MIFSTWPVMPSASGDASHTAPAAGLSGDIIGLSASSSPWPTVPSRRVAATGAMEFTRTPERSSSRASTIVMLAMPALAAA